MNNAAELKRNHELEVFLEFGQTVGLAGNLNTAEVRDPPEPDIYYPAPAQPCYFELGRLADDNYAKFVLEVQRRTPMPVAPDISKIGYPQRDVLLRKLAKTYQTGGLPVHLVLYFDNEHLHTEGPIPPMPFNEEAAFVMEPILRNSMGPFTKVWYFERYCPSLLWSYP